MVRTSETAAGPLGVAPVSAAQPKCGSFATYTISRRGRFWEVCDEAGTLVCITVYKCGAREVVRRLDT